MSVLTPDRHSFSVTQTYRHKLVFSRWGQVVRETMGSRKTPAQRTFTLSHPLPQKSKLVHTSSLQITAQYYRENLLFPHPRRMTGPYCFHSFTPPLPWLLSVLGTGYGGIFLFSGWYFLRLLLTWFTLFFHHQGNMISKSVIVIFKCVTDGWAFLVSVTSCADHNGK